VIDQGRLIEQGSTRELFANPSRQRTASMMTAASGFISASPPRKSAGTDDQGAALLETRNLSVAFRERRAGRRQKLHAVQDISLTIGRGETLAVVGESGSGKTSLARAIVGLLAESSGTVSFLGNSLEPLVETRSNKIRRQLQMVFQDPVGSLNPAMRVGTIIAEPLLVHERSMTTTERVRASDEMLARVGLSADLRSRYPHELSGGQAQRVAIARALIMKPAVLICDEAVAALDGSVRQEVLGLLQAEQQRSSLSLLVITHDLAVVQQLSHRVLIMYMGRLFEMTGARELFRRPKHPYTRLLLDSTPLAGRSPPPDVPVVASEPASILNPPSGCVFHPRCPHAIERCLEERPALQSAEHGIVACHRAQELDLSR